MSKYIKLGGNYNKGKLKEAADCINNGDLVLFPTETVYGIGANGLDASAIEKIFVAKGRKQDNPLILHVSNMEMINIIAKDINPIEKILIDNFFPGPFTIILKKRDIVPLIATGNLDTVGVRMPSNKIAHDLIEFANVPIAAPSANISGRPSGTNVSDIFDELNDKVSYIIDGGDTDIGLESTVVRVVDDVVHILRPGKITVEDIKRIGLDVIVDENVLNKVSDMKEVASPGMKYRHYAPKTNCLLVFSKDNKKFIDKVRSIEKEKKILVLCRNSNVLKFKNALPLGDSLEEISQNLFTILRKVDDYDVELVVIEGVNIDGLGLAIMNRLIRACSYNYIKL